MQGRERVAGGKKREGGKGGREDMRRRRRRGEEEEGEKPLYSFHRTNFDLSLLAGRCCNKLLVVKGLDTSWHPLQKSSMVLPVSFRFGMKDGRVVIQSLLHASTSGWQHLG